MSDISDNPDVLVDRDGSGIVVVTLNRPKTKNSVPFTSWVALGEIFQDIAARADDRVVVLTGAEGNFCSGAELGAAGSQPPPPRRAMQIVNATCAAIRDLPKPTIAAVSGYAVGAGFNLALACDLAIADETAKFSQIFAKRGLSVDFGGTFFLANMIGLHRAKELAFFGRMLPASEVHAMGLLNRIVPESESLALSIEWATELLGLAPTAISQTKELLNLAGASTFPESLMREAIAQNFNGTTEDSKEAIQAFLDKRDPVFLGR